MAEHQAYEVKGAQDIELGTPRPAPVRYTLTLPGGFDPGRPVAGLVLLIPGFGADNDSGYLESFCGWVADTFGLACVSVAYHACNCRVSSGATRQFKEPDARRLYDCCQQLGVVISERDTPGTLLVKVHEAYQAQVAAGRASGMLTLTSALVTPGGEKQNFGLMQALDHLLVLADLRSRIDYDTRNVIAIGSSHGGYLAHLIAKLAPNTLRAVFDNSGYAAAPDRYINGRELVLPDYTETYSAQMRMYFFLESMWSLDPEAPNYFHADARSLRCLSERAHLLAMAGAGSTRTRYRCVHGPDDPIAPTSEKADYCAKLEEAGFDVQFRCMGPGDVDGRYVKTLEHGMGLSLRGFFERSYASLPEADLSGPADAWAGDDFHRRTELVYEGPERAYRFKFDSSGCSAQLASRS